MYVATTAAAGCLLGVGVSDTADAAGLTQAYGEFQREAMMLNPDYTPQSVNTDGWESTQVAWKTLFPPNHFNAVFSTYNLRHPTVLPPRTPVIHSNYG